MMSNIRSATLSLRPRRRTQSPGPGLEAAPPRGAAPAPLALVACTRTHYWRVSRPPWPATGPVARRDRLADGSSHPRSQSQQTAAVGTLSPDQVSRGTVLLSPGIALPAGFGWVVTCGPIIYGAAAAAAWAAAECC